MPRANYLLVHLHVDTTLRWFGTYFAVCISMYSPRFLAASGGNTPSPVRLQWSSITRALFVAIKLAIIGTDLWLSVRPWGRFAWTHSADHFASKLFSGLPKRPGPGPSVLRCDYIKLSIHSLFHWSFHYFKEGAYFLTYVLIAFCSSLVASYALYVIALLFLDNWRVVFVYFSWTLVKLRSAFVPCRFTASTINGAVTAGFKRVCFKPHTGLYRHSAVDRSVYFFSNYFLSRSGFFCFCVSGSLHFLLFEILLFGVLVLLLPFLVFPLTALCHSSLLLLRSCLVWF